MVTKGMATKGMVTKGCAPVLHHVWDVPVIVDQRRLGLQSNTMQSSVMQSSVMHGILFKLLCLQINLDSRCLLVATHGGQRCWDPIRPRHVPYHEPTFVKGGIETVGS